MQLRFWASPSGRIWFSGTQKEKKKTHKLAIQSSPSFFNLWLRRLLEIGSNALTPACHCALTGVSSSISGGWSWRRHPELGCTLALFLCFLSHSPLNTPPPSALCSTSFHLLFLRSFFHFNFFQLERSIAITTKWSIFTSTWSKKRLRLVLVQF